MREKCLAKKKNNIQGLCEYTKGHNHAVYQIFFIEEEFYK